MTQRLSVDTQYVNFIDGQKVVEEDIEADQSHVLQSDAAIVNNFFGSGLLLETPNINTIFDSDNLTSVQQQYVSTNDFDGRGISPHTQPTDSILGCQLEVILSNADVALRRGVKVCIIGTDFQNNSQYEVFDFHANESQLGKKHFKTVITILFNDFKGNKNGSKTLGGSVLIREASPMQLSRDEITASQNYEPNLFFRDFKVVDQTVGPNPTMVLYETLRTALGISGYTVDSLNINIGYVDKKALIANDISTRYGQKFLAKVNNIQKIRILLGVEKDMTAIDPADWFDWSGDIIVSIHAIQTAVQCPTDTIPDNAIDYQPFPAPIVQVILTQSILNDKGLTLTDIAQPIDVSFVNTRVGAYANTGITEGNYYIVTIQRAGDATVGQLFTETGRNFTDDSVFSAFNGTTWVDDATIDLWFEIYSDSLKISSGMGYDAGSGIEVNKTHVDADTGSTLDYSADGFAFANNGQGILNHTVVQAITELITQVQSSRTGGKVYSRKHNSAEVSTLTSAQLTTLEQTSDPIVLGCAYDINNKSSIIFEKVQDYIGMADAYLFCIVNPAPELLLYNLVGSIFNPNIANVSATEYLIYKVSLCTDGYGDIDGDGYISAADIIKLNSMIGEDITTASTQQKILDGYFTTLEFLRADIDGNGVINGTDVGLILQIYNKNIVTPLPHGTSFQHVCFYLENKYGRNDGYHSSWEGWARIWDPIMRHAQYGVDPLLLVGANTLPYYGYPVPVAVETEPALQTVPFVPITYRITVSPNWFREFVKVNYTGRLMPCSFVDMTGVTKYECTDPVITYCDVVEQTNTCDGGKNDFFVPDNLIMGNGQILAKAGGYFPVDMEVNTITLKLPALPINNKALDVFSLFVAESAAHKGFTTAGYQAMKFADCSYVQTDALAKNQIRFAVALESLSIAIDGYDGAISDDAYGVIVDPLIGTFIDHETGVLTIRGTNMYSEPDITFNCKICITVYMKQAGWKNTHTEVLPNELQELMGL